MVVTNANVQAAKPGKRPVKLADGGGLYLEVRPSGAKLWRYRYRIAGKENIFAIGEFFADKRPGHVSLEAARRARDEAREFVRKGMHPAHVRKAQIREHVDQNQNTFKAIALEWMDRNKQNWSDTYAAQIETVLTGDVFPSIGALPITSVKAAHILAIMQRVEKRGASTFAHLIRQWASAIFRYAVATLRAEHDPASALKGAIVRRKTKHHRALSKSELQSLLKRVKDYSGDPGTRFGIPLMALTFVRTVELRAARWSEIDFDAAEWRIPASRMKMKEEHIVPLSRQALQLLRELKMQTGNREYLFPNRRRRNACMTSTTINRALERMGFAGEDTIGFSGHGFRSTASTMLNEAGFNPDAVERQLAHQERNEVRRSYNRATYLKERRQMMQAWADMVDQIVNIRRAAA